MNCDWAALTKVRNSGSINGYAIYLFETYYTFGTFLKG